MPEKDPHGLQPGESGAKLDAEKPRMELLQDFGLALMEVAKVATFGAEKYSEGGWQEVKNGIQRYSGAMQRHFYGERYSLYDPAGSGLLQAAQTAWNALARLELMLREMQEQA